MYRNHFGLTADPFTLSPNLKFVFMSRAHEETMAHLAYGLEQGEDFILITGEIGTGKTLALHNLISQLSSSLRTIFINVTRFSFRELLKYLLQEAGVEVAKDADIADLLVILKQYLIAQREEGFRVLVIIDEAQNLDVETLEGLRMLTNLAQPGDQVLQIVLSGQLGLEENIARPDLIQLRQRIRVEYRLETLDRRELQAYVEHRLRVAGCNQPLFKPKALDLVYELTAGIPRLVNHCVSKSLLAAFVDGATQVDRKHVDPADLPAIPDQSRKPVTAPAPPPPPPATPVEPAPPVAQAPPQSPSAPPPPPPAAPAPNEQSRPPVVRQFNQYPARDSAPPRTHPGGPGIAGTVDSVREDREDREDRGVRKDRGGLAPGTTGRRRWWPTVATILLVIALVYVIWDVSEGFTRLPWSQRDSAAGNGNRSGAAEFEAAPDGATDGPGALAGEVVSNEVGDDGAEFDRVVEEVAVPTTPEKGTAELGARELSRAVPGEAKPVDGKDMAAVVVGTQTQVAGDVAGPDPATLRSGQQDLARSAAADSQADENGDTERDAAVPAAAVLVGAGGTPAGNTEAVATITVAEATTEDVTARSAEEPGSGATTADEAGLLPVGYCIHVASFADQVRAREFSENLVARRLSAFVRATPVREKTWFRVYLGPYESLATAEDIQRQLVADSTINYSLIVDARHG